MRRNDDNSVEGDDYSRRYSQEPCWITSMVSLLYSQVLDDDTKSPVIREMASRWFSCKIISLALKQQEAA